MVVALRYQEDMDPSEIAALLEIPVSTVKSHLHRSLTLLRARLARQAGANHKAGANHDMEGAAPRRVACL